MYRGYRCAAASAYLCTLSGRGLCSKYMIRVNMHWLEEKRSRGVKTIFIPIIFRCGLALHRTGYLV